MTNTGNGRQSFKPSPRKTISSVQRSTEAIGTLAARMELTKRLPQREDSHD